MIPRRARPLFLLVALILTLAACRSEAGRTVRVRYVIDGDTVVLSTGEKVRYLGINAPEVAHDEAPGEPFGDEARRRNKELVLTRKVRLEFGPRREDPYGRLLAYVYLEDGRLVNEILLEEGLAWLYDWKGLRLRRRLLLAQRRALSGRRGLWALRVRPEPYYIGNRRSLKFHRPGCTFGRKTSRRYRVRFKTRFEALWEGYAPCRRCRP